MKIVVGDKFTDFIEETGNVGFSALYSHPEVFRGSPLVIGQGLSTSELDALRHIAGQFDIKLLHDGSVADCSITHKHQLENCVISVPERISTDVYEAELIFDDDNELLLDHITGLHVQGMLLVEACRQMFISVAMDYFSTNFFAERRYGAINRMDTRFEAYVFPIPATLRYTRTEVIKDTERDCISFSGDIEVFQASRRVMSMQIKHTYYKMEKLEPVEQHKARSACKRLVESFEAAEQVLS